VLVISRSAFFVLVAAVASPAHAQKLVDITGTWRVAAGADTKDGPHEVIVRADSSASWGKETVRWRLKENKISIVLGGEWETHNIKVKDNTMTISGGTLTDPLVLHKVGPPTPRPAGAKIPPDPDSGG